MLLSDFWRHSRSSRDLCVESLIFFGPPKFLRRASKALTEFYKSGLALNTWQSLVTIGRAILEIAGKKEISKHLQQNLMACSASRAAERPYMYTVSQKTYFFCQNFVKFRPTVKIFGTKIAKRTSFSEVYSFSASPNLRQRTTVLNADVINCYITL